ncbi:MAG: hypothetical protein R2712_13775 [Vicinamibacterales bacterium]
MTPTLDQLAALSHEFAIVADAAGTLTWVDARAEALAAARAGMTLGELCTGHGRQGERAPRAGGGRARRQLGTFRLN